MIKKLLILSLVVIVCTVGFNACTKLNEQILDESSVTGLTDKQIAEGNIAPVYAVLPGLFLHTNYFALQEISTDEAILPYRGGTDWGDNGIYIDLHRHNYTSTHVRVNDAWNSLSQGSSRALTAILAMKNLDDPKAPLYLAEARGIRAYYAMVTLDLFGLIFKKEDPAVKSEILRGNDAVEYIASELLAIEDQVSTETGPGRISRGAVWGLLARLYLNA